MGKPAWIENVLDTARSPNMDIYTYSADICYNSEMYPGSQKFAPVNLHRPHICSSPDSGNQDVYFNIKRDSEGQYNTSYINLYNSNTFEAYSPENGEIIASVSPDHNHINALFTQTSPRVEMSSYNEGQISKIHVLTPNELSIKAANELAALEMNDGFTAEATDRILNLGQQINSNITAVVSNERQRKDQVLWR